MADSDRQGLAPLGTLVESPKVTLGWEAAWLEGSTDLPTARHQVGIGAS